MEGATEMAVAGDWGSVFKTGVCITVHALKPVYELYNTVVLPLG